MNDTISAITNSSRWNSLLAILGVVVVAGSLIGGIVAGTHGHKGLSGKPMMHFSGRTAAGQAVETEDYRGRVVVLKFWATWCPPCVESLPEAQRIQNELGPRGVQVVGISADSRREDLMNVERRFGLDFPTVFEGAEPVFKAYGVRYLPTTVVIDREGRVVWVGSEGDSFARVENLVAE